MILTKYEQAKVIGARRTEETRLRARDVQHALARGYYRFAKSIRTKELELQIICPSLKEWNHVWDYMINHMLITSDGPVYWRLGIRL